MENYLMTRRKTKFNKNTQAVTMCKKHPKHRQSPGVCSICLREKLSKLPSMTSSSSSSRATATITNASSTSSSLSSLSSLSSQCSSNPSSCSSPTRPMHDGKGYLLSFLKSNKIVLTKSRSMTTFVVGEREHGMINKKKKGGFWSKLIGSKTSNKRMVMMGEGTGGRLMHSRTMRDMLSTRA